MTDEELLAQRDDDIIRRAQLWATGATIHDINCLIGMYRSATAALDGVHGMDTRAQREPKIRRFALEMMVCAANTLAAFMQHGDYRKARDSFPLPTHPDDEGKPPRKRR